MKRSYDFPWSSSKDQYLTRLKICKACEHRKFGVCMKCGCPLYSKALMKKAKCPLDKWGDFNLKEIIVSDYRETFIGAWYLDDINVCDGLIEYFDQSNDKWQGQIGLRYTADEDRVNKDKKDSWDVSVGLNCRDTRWINYIDQLQLVVEEYKKKYPFCDTQSPWTMLENSNIQYYPPGGGFKVWHTERGSARYPNSTRHLVYMTYLNDIPEEEDEYAGGTEWFHQELKFKPKKGATVIWPADWTHIHRGIVSAKSSKYIVTGWFSFND